MSLRVTVRDNETGDEEVANVDDGDYFIVTANPCYVRRVQAYTNGTHVLTVRGRTAGRPWRNVSVTYDAPTEEVTG